MPSPRGKRAILPLLLYCSLAPADPAWILDAAQPGPDLPPAGESRFDQLFRAGDGSYRLPYPFERLIDYVEARVDNDAGPAVRQVFVPVGRSLQRDSSAPDYFRYPRRVIAVEGEAVNSAGEAGRVLEYRLFIAHQPSTGRLEIISYNDDAARFEFQLVDDYRAGRDPRVRPANRVMCLSCHQNAAPIFARNPWSETTFNVAVARRLAAALPERYASQVDVITLDAGVIDVLAERANYLAAAQFIWREGCASPACRAAMLRAALQYRLSGKINFDHEAVSYRRDYYAQLQDSWRDRWPGGLALPGSRIPDRDPFAVAPRELSQDPLMPRPPQASWQQFDTALAAGVVFRLGGFFTLADIRRLDRRLVKLAAAGTAPGLRLRAACRVAPKVEDALRLVCDAAQGLRATLELETGRQGIVELRVVALKLPFDANLWQPEILQLSAFDRRLVAQFGNRRSGLSQRLASGDRLVSMTLDWTDLIPADGASLEIEVSREFGFLDAALERMRAGDDGSRFAGGVFNREALLRPLMRELGMPPLDWGRAAIAAPQAAAGTAARLDGDLSLLQPYCAHCHAGDGPNPPPFLSADAAGGTLERCAPRMLARLRAWQPGQALDRAPMPPPASVAYRGISAARWPSSAHYRSLLSSLEQMVAAAYGSDAAARWRQAGYDRLPPCGEALSE